MFFSHAKTFEECPSGQKESSLIPTGERERNYTPPQFEIGSSTTLRCSKNAISRTGIWAAALPSDADSELTSTEKGEKERLLAPLDIGKIKENQQCVFLDEIEDGEDGKDRDLDASGSNSVDATEYFIDSSTSSEEGSHEGNEWFRCKVCKKVFFARKTYTRHKRSCLEVERNCPYCSKFFPKMIALRNHVKAVHKNDRSFLCDICGKTFLELRYLKWHTLTHTKLKEHTCEECGKCFTHHWHLKSHAVIHSDEKPFQCEECGRNFRRFSTLRFHKRTHSNERPHKCDVCGKSFTQPSSLKTHQKLHSGERPHICNVCNERFGLKSALQSHMRTHTKEKPFNCVICSKSFAQSSTLKNHLKTHENDKISENVGSNEDSVGRDEAKTVKKTKNHDCELCGRSFSAKSTLKIHMMRHKGERPHKCDICSKSFTLSSTLKIHMRTHTGDKPYACSLCHAQFTYKYVLEKHRLKHKENSEKGEKDACSDQEDDGDNVELSAIDEDCFDTNQLEPEILQTLSRAESKNVIERNKRREDKHKEVIKNIRNCESGLDEIHMMSYSDENQGKNCKKITPMDFLAVFQSSLKASHD